MSETVELVSVQDDSDQENLLHLIEKICPPHTGEPAEAYKAFCNLALNKKTIRGVAAEQAIDFETLQTWTKDFHWAERVKQWKPIFQAYQRKQWQAREKAILDHWNDRRGRFLQVADQLLAKADLMLKHPHVQKTIQEEVVATRKGQIIPTKVVISPVKWQSGDVATLQKTALAMLQQVVGDREIMIDRLTSDGYIVSDPTSGDTDIHEYLQALEELEAQQEL